MSKRARMMELVDMRGLKPRPIGGPGSTPGMGTTCFVGQEFYLEPSVYCLDSTFLL